MSTVISERHLQRRLRQALQMLLWWLRSQLRTSNYKAALRCQLGKQRGSGCLLGRHLLLPQLDLHKFLHELDENCAHLAQANMAQ